MPQDPAPRRKNLIKWFFSSLGPGVITGAADDDPSGIATYSSAGALLGTGQLWTALITWPLMASVQMMCARIGMVTGRGLAGAFQHKLPKPLITVFAAALLVANTINIGADLSGMADAAQMLFGFNSHWLVVLFGLAIALATVFFRYHSIVARAHALCLRDHCVRGRSGLARGRSRHLRSDAAEGTCGMGDDRRYPRHDDQSLPILLAGLTGS